MRSEGFFDRFEIYVLGPLSQLASLKCLLMLQVHFCELAPWPVMTLPFSSQQLLNTSMRIPSDTQRCWDLLVWCRWCVIFSSWARFRFNEEPDAGLRRRSKDIWRRKEKSHSRPENILPSIENHNCRTTSRDLDEENFLPAVLGGFSRWEEFLDIDAVESFMVNTVNHL